MYLCYACFPHTSSSLPKSLLCSNLGSLISTFMS